MQIQRGVQLGALHRQLGIGAESRIHLQRLPTRMVIVDLTAGVQYTIAGNPPSVSTSTFEVPQWAKEIFAAKTEDLLKRWEENWLDGWTDAQETIFTELTFRGVNMLPEARRNR